MDKETVEAFHSIRTDIKGLSIQVGKLEQYNIDCGKADENTHKKKTESFGLWRVIISAVMGTLVVLQIIGIIK